MRPAIVSLAAGHSTRFDSYLPGLDFVNTGILAKIVMYDKRGRGEGGVRAGHEKGLW